MSRPDHRRQTFSATEAKNRFGALLREVSRSGGPVMVERAGRPVAVVLSPEAYRQACRPAAASPDRRERARAAFGMWCDRSDLGEDWLEQGRELWRSAWPDG